MEQPMGLYLCWVHSSTEFESLQYRLDQITLGTPVFAKKREIEEELDFKFAGNERLLYNFCFKRNLWTDSYDN